MKDGKKKKHYPEQDCAVRQICSSRANCLSGFIERKKVSDSWKGVVAVTRRDRTGNPGLRADKRSATSLEFQTGFEVFISG